MLVGLANSTVSVLDKRNQEPLREVSGLGIGPVVSIWKNEGALVLGGLGLALVEPGTYFDDVRWSRIPTADSLVLGLRGEGLEEGCTRVVCVVDNANSLRHFHFSKGEQGGSLANRSRQERRLRGGQVQRGRRRRGEPGADVKAEDFAGKGRLQVPDHLG